MEFTRRRLFASGAAGSLFLLGGKEALGNPRQPKLLKMKPRLVRVDKRKVRIRVGAMEGVLGGGGVKALRVAQKPGLEGVQLGAGLPADTLRICKRETINELKRTAMDLGVETPSICMGFLNRCPFISDPRVPGWVTSVIEAAKKLEAKVILIPFFGKGTLKNRSEMEKAAGIVKNLAPKAAEKGVTLALENTLSAEDNLFILEKAGNPPGLKVYYDIGNSTRYGYDVPKEIRLLGDRIAELHFKDYKNGVLGRGEVKMAPVAEAIVDIGYEGWIFLETKRTLGVEITAAVNGGYIRGLFEKWNRV